MQPVTERDLRVLFPDPDHAWTMPELQAVDWGVLDYFGWIHPSGHRGYAVMPIDSALYGVSLRRMLNHNAKPRTHMCSWCHHVYRSRGTAMFSAYVSGTNGRRSIGNYICRNLDCSLRIRNLASDPPTYLPETIDLERKVSRLRISVAAFMQRANLLADTTY